MSRHVFVLGAGASREAGGPLMSDFLDRAESLRDLGGQFEKASFDLVFRAIAQLRIAHSKAVLDIDNVESVLGAFEMARLFGSLGSLSSAEVAALPAAMDHVMSRTVESSLRYAVTNHRLGAPASYRQLTSLIQRLIQAKQSIAIFTFNYDLATDLAIHDAGFRPRYWLNEESPGNVDLLKLHGSLAWTKRNDSDVVVPLALSRHLDAAQTGFEPSKEQPLFITDRLHSLNVPVTGRPVIVPPTWSKPRYYEALATVWQQAARCLSDVENIYVLGYSLPDTDQFFRMLYALGTVSDTRLKRFWVFDPDPAVGKRFASLLGQAARARFAFDSITFDHGLFKVFAMLEDAGLLSRAG